MPKYHVEISARAQKEVLTLPRRIAENVDAAMRSLAQTPRPEGTKPLHGALHGLWRLRVSDWRVIYQIDEMEKLVKVTRVLHRSQAYRR